MGDLQWSLFSEADDLTFNVEQTDKGTWDLTIFNAFTDEYHYIRNIPTVESAMQQSEEYLQQYIEAKRTVLGKDEQ